MTDLLEHAVETIRAFSPAMQDELARVLLQLIEEEQPMVGLTSEKEEAVMQSRAAAAHGAFATDEQVRAIWAKYGL